MLSPAGRQPLMASQAQKPTYHPATAYYGESWSVINPNGREIHFGTPEEAEWPEWRDAAAKAT
jgi:hypothetical protein